MIYSVCDFLTNLGLIYTSHKPSKVFIYSAFTFAEYALFAFAIAFTIGKKTFEKVVFFTSIAFIIFLVTYTLNVKVRRIDSIPIGVEAILILVFSFYYLYEQMKDVSTLFIYNRFHFWIVLGMMLYLAGSFFIYIYASQLPRAEVEKWWVFTNVFSILKNIFFTIAIFVNGAQPTIKNKQHYPAFTLN